MKKLACLLFVLLITITKVNAQLDLGIAPNYSINFDESYDYKALADRGITRVNLYFTWKEFEIAFIDPNDPDGTTLSEVDPIIDSLQANGMKASIIIEVTNTDCGTGASDTCWLNYGIPPDITFTGWDTEPLLTRIKSFTALIATRYDTNIISHVFIGNETDMFLRDYPSNKLGFINMLQELQDTLNNFTNRASFGTIFTFTVNDPSLITYADSVAAECEVMAFTMYPTLESSWDDSLVVPTQTLIDDWFGLADSIAQNNNGRLVITETGYPTDAPIGTQAYQKQFAENVINFLNNQGSDIDFVTWYSLWDAPNHPDTFYHSCGILTYPGEVEKPAYPVWIGATTSIDDEYTPGNMPVQCYPNPAALKTKIRFQLQNKSRVTIELVDARGSRVSMLLNEPKSKGIHTIQFDVSDLPNGFYGYRLITGSANKTGTIVVIHK